MTQDEAFWRGKTAAMCRMLAVQDLIGMFGHVSIRIPGTDLVLLTPGAGAEKSAVKPADIFVFDIGGEILHHPGGDRPLQIPLEWRIHTRIHRDRPEVTCIAHLHAWHATILGIARQEIVPVFMHGAFLRAGVPVWDNPRLVVSDAQAASLSAALGDKLAVQMRGHGVCVVGDSPEAAFFRCTFLEENAQKQFAAECLGGAVALSPAEAADCEEGTVGPRLYRLLWEFYERKAAAAFG